MKKMTRRNVVYVTTVVCVTTVVSVVILVVMLTGMVKSEKRSGLSNDKSETNQYDVSWDDSGSDRGEDESETIQYSHQDKIDEDVWEQESDSDGKRCVMIFREGIPNEEFEAAFYEKHGFLPSDYTDVITVRSVKEELYLKYNGDFFERNSIDREWVLYNGYYTGSIIMYADEKLIRKMAEDESVHYIHRFEEEVVSNFD